MEWVLESRWEEAGPGFSLPVENYWPERYSPDGTKLLVTIGHFEGGSLGIYELARGELVRITGEEESQVCYLLCNGEEVAWPADSAGFFSANGQNDFTYKTGGLWHVDAASGAVTTLIPLGPAGGRINFPDEPHIGPDGLLYFFFVNYPELAGTPIRPPFKLVRSAPDGITGREVLRSDTFEWMNEALWAPDASFVFVAMAPDPDVYDGKQAKMVYLDGRPGVVLAEFAEEMKWGQ